MEYITAKEFQCKNTAVTLGKFDGLHIGHVQLIKQVTEKAENGCNSVVFSFLFPKKQDVDEVKLIYTEEEKQNILKEMGITTLISCPFDEEFMKIEPEEFIRTFLTKQLDARYIVVGDDYRFGYKRSGDVELLEEMASRYGYSFQSVPKVLWKGEEVSSSRIRECIKEGRMEDANYMLGRPYSITAEVRHGRKLGRQLGMPTINMIPSEEKLLPPNGVYVSGTILNGKEYPGITNIGVKPTVESAEDAVKIAETYIFDFEGDLYGQTLQVNLYSYERKEMKFSSIEELKSRMEQDVSYGRRYFDTLHERQA